MKIFSRARIPSAYSQRAKPSASSISKSKTLPFGDPRVGRDLQSDADLMFILEDGLFTGYSAEEKQEYDLMTKGLQTYFGYKGIGTSFADSSRGIKDRNEFWNVCWPFFPLVTTVLY